MPTVVDSLVLELGLDASKFSEGQQDAISRLRDFEAQAHRSGETIEGSGKKIIDLFQSFRRETLFGIGAFIGGTAAVSAINYITSLDASTGRLARTMDVSTQTLSAWQGALMQIGGSAESANSALSGLSSALGQFQLTKQPQEWMLWARRLGVNVYDQMGHIKDAAEIYRELGDALAGMDKREARAFLEKIPGINQDMINFLLLAKRQREEYLAIGRATAPTDDDVRRAEQFQQELGKTERAAINLGNTFLQVLGPAINWVLNSMADLLQGLHDLTNLPAHWFNWGQMLEGAITGHITPSAASSASAGGGSSRGDRNNNPGNIKYGPWAVAHGATGSDGTFAIFPTPQAGQAAMEDLLSGSSYSGLTLGQIQQKWVGNYDPNYLGGLESATGLGAGDVPNLSDPAVRAAIARGISRGEGTHLNAAGFAPNVWRGGGSGAPAGSTSEVNVTVGDVFVNAPNAKDSPSAVAEVGPALKRSLTASAANYSQQ